MSIAEQQNEVLMNNHSVCPVGSMAMAKTYANVAESSRNHKRGRGRGKWKGKEVPYSKAKERKNPKV